MPPRQLNPTSVARSTAVKPDDVADGVLAVLAGLPLEQIAARLDMEADDLGDAIQTYQEAGRVALHAQADRDWYQISIQFSDWVAAEATMATNLGPRLQQLQGSGVITGWWFIRKAPCWRLRLRPGRNVAAATVETSVGSILVELRAAGLISQRRRTLYQPEILAFGGPLGMDIAHGLFCSDSSGILDYLRRPEPVLGRRELSTLLCSTLFHAAGQEWFECGDVWHRVARLRPIPADTPTDRLPDLADTLRRLLIHDAHPDGTLCSEAGPLAFAAPWAAAYHRAGHALGAAASDGALDRGVRDILAHHVIFHWNRFGFSTRTQGVLASAARDAVMRPLA